MISYLLILVLGIPISGFCHGVAFDLFVLVYTDFKTNKFYLIFPYIRMKIKKLKYGFLFNGTKKQKNRFYNVPGVYSVCIFSYRFL